MITTLNHINTLRVVAEQMNGIMYLRIVLNGMAKAILQSAPESKLEMTVQQK